MERRQNINIPVRTPLVSLTRSMGTTGIYHLGSILSPASNRSSNRRSSCRGSTGLNRAEEGAKSEAPGWELRELREREEEQEAEVEKLGAAEGSGAGEELPLFLPTPSFMTSAGEGYGDGVRFPLFLSLCQVPWTRLLFLGTGLGGGQRGACNEPPLCGLRTGKPGKMYAAMIYIGRMRVRLNKKKHARCMIPLLCYGGFGR